MQHIIEIIEELKKLNTLIRVQPYYCRECGAEMQFSNFRIIGYHTLGGSPLYQGVYRCPNDRWYRFSHSTMMAQYAYCDLNVFYSNEGHWEHFERLWMHELEKRLKEDNVNKA